MSLTTRDASLPAAYSQALEAQALGPLWTALHQLLPTERGTAAVPHVWRWKDARPLLLEAGRLVPIEQAERRVLVLDNPGLKGRYAITSTLYAGLQIILPGEAAPRHHHTPAALRLVVEGTGAFTTVDGVKCVMEPGDFIITPPMRWHDHGHEGGAPVVWLDGLDIPLVRAFDASWVSALKPSEPPRMEVDPSVDELTTAGLVPRRSRYPASGYPMVRWPWRTTRQALGAMATTASKDTPIVLAYVDPVTGRPPLRTMGAEAWYLRPGERTRRERRTAGSVFHVIEGRGVTIVGETSLTWEAGDTFVAPPWHWVSHENHGGDAPACLFAFNDAPAVDALGLLREEIEP